MVLDRQLINYPFFSSLSLKHSTEILRSDADKVQNWISKGSSLVLTKMDKLSEKINNIVREFQIICIFHCKSVRLLDLIMMITMFLQFLFKDEKVWNIL